LIEKSYWVIGLAFAFYFVNGSIFSKVWKQFIIFVKINILTL